LVYYQNQIITKLVLTGLPRLDMTQKERIASTKEARKMMVFIENNKNFR
jgi:hypothetical protein